MSETSEKKIKAIEAWTSMRTVSTITKVDSIAIKYLNDLLEYIEDMGLLQIQEDHQVVQDRYRKNIRKELEEELELILARTTDYAVAEEIEERVEAISSKHIKHYEENLHEEKIALAYLKWIPIKFILKSLVRRLFWEEKHERGVEARSSDDRYWDS